MFINRSDGGRQLVGALRPTGGIVRPLGSNDPLVLHRSEHSVEIPQVDLVVWYPCSQGFGKVISVGGTIPEDGEDERFVEPFHPCCDAPGSVVSTVPGTADASSAASVVVWSSRFHGISIC